MKQPMTESAKPKQTRGHCPNCGPDKFADIVAEHTEHYPAEEECKTEGKA
jgi:ribosomal protein S27AE